MVANLDIGDIGTDFLDHAGAFVTQHDRHRHRQLAVDHRQIRHAQPGGRHADADFVVLGRIELDLAHRIFVLRGKYHGLGFDRHVCLATSADFFGSVRMRLLQENRYRLDCCMR